MSTSNASPTLHLHIGTEKTGTTTLQSMANKNRQTLAAHGVLYPEAPGKQNHAGLAIYALKSGGRPGLRHTARLQDDEDVAAYRQSVMTRLRQEVIDSGCPHVLLSNEHLSSRLRNEAAVRRLVDGLRETSDKIRVLIYLRPQYELVVSSYSTSVKSGRATPIRLERGPAEHYYNYDRMLGLWESVVGIENIQVRRFLPREFTGGSLISDFFAALGVEPPPDLQVPDPRNRSLDANTLEFLRIVNEQMPKFVDGNLNEARADILAGLQQISSGPKFTVSGAALAEIDATFTAANQAVAERYFPGSSTLFPPFTAADTPPSPPLGVREAVEIGLALWSLNGRRKRRARTPASTDSEPAAEADVPARGRRRGGRRAL
jgi:hypothetical protein